MNVIVITESEYHTSFSTRLVYKQFENVLFYFTTLLQDNYLNVSKLHDNKSQISWEPWNRNFRIKKIFNLEEQTKGAIEHFGETNTKFIKENISNENNTWNIL